MNPTITPEGPGSVSVSGAPNLPAGFTDTFTSRYIDAGELRLHAVIGGEGPPLLLVHGWPENWYAWRLLMPTLAQDFEVIAVDQRLPVRPGRVDHRSWAARADPCAPLAAFLTLPKGVRMSEATRSASSPAVVLVHGAFADAVLEIGGAGK
jgi:hypothetical protein